MRRDKKLTKKQARSLLNQLPCRLCGKPSNSIHVNGFCICIATPEDYEFVVAQSPSGRAARMQKLRESSKPILLKKYRDLGGVRTSGLKDRIKQSVSDKKRNNTREQAISRSMKNEFYESWAWKELRFKILTKFGARCMLCGVTSKEAKICVDHIKPLSTHWNMRLDSSNLQVLCDACNKGKSNKHEHDFRTSLTL